MPSACSRLAAVGQRPLAVEDADIVQPQETAGEEVLAVQSLRLTHQVKFINSFWNARRKKRHSRFPLQLVRSGRLASRPRRAPAD